MVVPPALPTAAKPAAEVWDNDDDFDFEADGAEGNSGGLLGHNPLALRRPASFHSDVDIYDDNGEAVGAYSGSSGSGDHRGPASVSGSASSRTSRSGMSSSAHTYRSTDLTDLESSPRNSFHSQGDASKNRTDASSLSPNRAYDLSRALSTSPTAIADPFSFSRQSSPQRQGNNNNDSDGNNALNDAASADLELDFELGDGVQQLHLAPSTLRKRASAEVWDADAGVADAKSSLARSSPSPSHRSLGDSDNDGALGDDESEAAEPIEEGLDLPESIFGSAGAAGLGVSSTDSPSAKLRAILDARLRGQHSSAAATPSQMGKGPSMMDRLAGGALDFDADTDVVTGLVITDDLDLSPSRLAAKSLSYKTRRSLGGLSMTPANTIPRSQQHGPATDRPRPSGTNARTWTSSPSAQLPTVILTNSSPAQHDRTLPSQRSPPRAMSSYSHATGAGPRVSKGSSSSKADPFRSVSPSALSTGSSRSQTLLSPDAGYSHSHASQQRKSLVRKRSMPHLSDQTTSPSPSPTSAAISAVHASITANTSALSRLMASTASSRAREAETAAKYAMKGETELAQGGGGAAAGRGSPTNSSPTSIRMPPSRPSTPVNGAVRYTLNTTTSRFRRMAAGAAAGAAFVAAAGGLSDGTPSSSRPGSASGGRLSMYSAITASAAAAKDAARVMRRPARARNYGTGTELDAFDDLPTNQEAESRFRRTPLRQASNATQLAAAAAATTTTTTTTSGDETLKVRPRDLPNLLTAMKDGGATLKASNAQLYGASNAVAGPSTQRTGSSQASATAAAGTKKRNQRGGASGGSTTTSKSKKPTLIRNLGGNTSNRSRVVGDMRWNPAMQRWEGNESALRAFDNVVNSSSRPALISPLTTSSVSSLLSAAAGSSTSSLLSPTAAVTSTAQFGKSGAGKVQLIPAAPRLQHTSSSPAGICSSFVEPQGSVQGTRIVGDMMFDPVQMCWFSMAGTEEPDVFAGLGDDGADGNEDDEGGHSSSGERTEAVSAVSSHPTRTSGMASLTAAGGGGGGWSSGWTTGVDSGRGGRSVSTAPTTDEEDELSKSVGGGSDFAGALRLPPGSPLPPSPYLDSSSASAADKSALHTGSALLGVGSGAAQYQQQTLTARRIKSADLLRSTPSASLGGAHPPLSPVDSTVAGAAAGASTSSPMLGSPDTDVDDDELRKLCLEAESRHRKEVRGFLPKGATSPPTANAALPAAPSESLRAGSRSGSKTSCGGGAIVGEVDPRSHLFLLQRLAREAGR